MLGYTGVGLRRLPAPLKEPFLAVRCGLCHAVRSRHGLPFCVCLNHELCVALVANAATSAEVPRFFRGTCVGTPLIWVPLQDYLSPCYARAADICVLLAHEEISDNRRDGDRVWWGIADTLLERRLDSLSFDPNCISRPISHFYDLEWEGGDSRRFDQLLDAHADVGVAVANVLQQGSDRRNRVLANICACMGKWIYLIDACDDWESDQKRGIFNPLSLLGDKAIVKTYIQDLESELSRLASMFPYGRYSVLLRYMLVDNLRRKSRRVLSRCQFFGSDDSE